MAVIINGGAGASGSGSGSSSSTKYPVRASTHAPLAATRSSNVLTFNSFGALTKGVLDSGWTSGPALSLGDRILVRSQAAAEDNGIYTVTDLGSGSTLAVLTRSSDANTSASIIPQMLVPVSEGTDANVFYYLAEPSPIVLNTTPLFFAPVTSGSLGPAGGDLSGNYPNPSVVRLTIPGAAQGSILYFDGSSWTQLPPGSAGQFLQSQGPGADPTWAPGGSGGTTVTGTTVNGGTTTLTTISVAAGQSAQISVEYLGRAVAAPYDTVGFIVEGTFRNDGSSVHALGSSSVRYTRQDPAVAVAVPSFSPSGSSVLIRVTGAPGKTIQWTAVVAVLYRT